MRARTTAKGLTRIGSQKMARTLAASEMTARKPETSSPGAVRVSSALTGA
jgi:hypothetical protein